MEGYQQNQYAQPIKRYVQTLELTNDAEAIRQYRRLHAEGVHWREIREGIRAVGILEMEVYICGNRLVMIVDAPVDFNWDEAMARLATLPRQAEWEDTVGKFQRCEPGATSAEKWKMMERMFHLYRDDDAVATPATDSSTSQE
jgi:L-rhamnose mutarotase